MSIQAYDIVDALMQGHDKHDVMQILHLCRLIVKKKMLSDRTLERISQSDTTNNSLVEGLTLLLRFLKKTGKNTEQFVIHLLKYSVERYGIVDRHRTITSPSAYHSTIEQILSTTKHSGIQKETMSDEIGVDIRGGGYVMKRTLGQDLDKLLSVS